MGDKKTFSRPWMDRIPSRDMREHLKKLNYKFTDLQLYNDDLQVPGSGMAGTERLVTGTGRDNRE